MYKTILFTHKGIEREECKDVCQYKELENATIIALSDGVSTQPYSGLGATSVQENIVKVIEDNSELEKKQDNDLQFEIACAIRETLYRLSLKKQCTEEKFAATLMMIICPKDTDFYWTIHIGDGMIGWLDTKKDSIRVLSPPENGITRQYTYTFVCADLLRRLRIKRHMKKEGHIFMMTDGITNEIYKDEESQSQYEELIKAADWNRLESKLLEEKVQDDIGFCSMQLKI